MKQLSVPSSQFEGTYVGGVTVEIGKYLRSPKFRDELVGQYLSFEIPF